jgi:hypothetical protein
MRLWLDTEFNDFQGELISLALVAEDGGYWYGVRHCDDPSPWVREHVIPVLSKEPEDDDALRRSLSDWLDYFLSCHITADWPEDISHFCNFLITGPGKRLDTPALSFEIRRDLPSTSKTSAVPHNALEDARALMRSDLEKDHG